jgi:hypothetical protein
MAGFWADRAAAGLFGAAGMPRFVVDTFFLKTGDARVDMAASYCCLRSEGCGDRD